MEPFTNGPKSMTKHGHMIVRDITLIDIESRNINFLKTLKGIYQKEAYTFCQFSLNKDKSVLCLPSSEPAVTDCVDLLTNKKINQLRPSLDLKINRGMLMNLKSIDSDLILSGYESGELALFDLRNSKELASIDLFNGQPLICFDYCENKKLGFAGSAESDLKPFYVTKDVKNDQEVFIIKSADSVKLVNPGINSIKIRSTDSKIFACGCWDSRIRVYSFSKKAILLAVLDFHKEAINTIDFSDDCLMTAGSNDGIISFWNIFN